MREDSYGRGGRAPRSFKGGMGEWETRDGSEGREVGEASSTDYGNLDGACQERIVLVVMIGIVG